MRSLKQGATPGNSDFELNLAPIIDCFTVLMTYLLATASFLALTSLEVSLSGSGDTAEPAERIPVALTLEIRPEGRMAIVARGAEGQTLEQRALGDGAAAGGELRSVLAELKSKWPEVHTLVISAEDSVPYESVVKGVEVARTSYPNVTLGDRIVAGGVSP